jgi:uncharacterized protein
MGRGVASVHDRAYVSLMRYEWNEAKARTNLKKHQVRFADAVAVFSDESGLTLVDPHSDEERYVTMGIDALGRVLVVAYTWRGSDTIRLISARRATRQEQDQYARGEL